MLAKPEHEVMYQDLAALLSKHKGKVSSLEMLAIAANMTGKIVAMQDQRTVTPQDAVDVVSKNMELGNAQVIAELSKTQGRA